jgi:hypothetical protein
MKLYYDADYKVIKPGTIIHVSEGLFCGYTDDEFEKHKFVLQHSTSIPDRTYENQEHSPGGSQTITKCVDGSLKVVMENLFLDGLQNYTLYVLDINEFRSEHLIRWGGQAETVIYYKVLIIEVSRVLWVSLRSLHGSCTIILD